MSVAEGAAQTPLVQTRLWQSLAFVHFFPTPHAGAPSEALFGWPLDVRAPPQSTSVSLSFVTPSWKVGGWHVSATVPEPSLVGPPSRLSFRTGPLAQTPDMQSSPMAQVLPFLQAGAPSDIGCFMPLARTPPPQSTSVSLSFFTPSLSVGALHRPLLHTTLAQSPPTLQVSPAGQPPH